MTAPCRAVFLGSGAFALPVLDALAGSAAVRIVGVITAPPRPAGRGRRERATPVSDRAAELGLRLLAPDRLRSPDNVALVAALEPELLVLADYGQLVPPAVLDLPRLGALNLHPSLLPRHRGAAPIAAAILAADAETGVTLMRMEAGLDSGPIVAQRRLPLSGRETAPALEETLASLAAALLRDVLPAWLDGDVAAVPQPSEGVTMTRPLRREDGRLDPRRSARELERQVRALQPWPGSFLETDLGRLIVWAAEATDLPAPGSGILVTDGAGLALGVMDGRLRLVEVQLGGGRRMSGAEVRRGHPRLLQSRVRDAALG